MIATFIISLAFCGVIPILYPVTLVSFLLLYFADKFLLFKYYQTPIQYSVTLHNAFMKTLYFAIWVHFGLTAYLLAEPTLIANGAYLGTKYSSVSSGNGRVDNIFRTTYIIPYAIMFLLMIIFVFFKQGIINLVIQCFDMIDGKIGY